MTPVIPVGARRTGHTAALERAVAEVIARPELASTEGAAEAVGVKVTSFRAWAADRGLKPAHRVRIGRSTRALWDLDEVYAAERRGITRRK
jgi:hypothetical protein